MYTAILVHQATMDRIKRKEWCSGSELCLYPLFLLQRFLPANFYNRFSELLGQWSWGVEETMLGPLNGLALSGCMFSWLFMVSDRVVFVLGRAGWRMPSAEKATGLYFPLGWSPRLPTELWLSIPKPFLIRWGSFEASASLTQVWFW